MIYINRWGHEHESHAYDAYSREITKLHKDFEISKPGFLSMSLDHMLVQHQTEL